MSSLDLDFTIDIDIALELISLVSDFETCY